VWWIADEQPALVLETITVATVLCLRPRATSSCCDLLAAAIAQPCLVAAFSNYAAGPRHSARLRRQAGGDHGRIAGRLRHILSQNAWLPVFRTLGVDLWAGGRLLVSRAGSVFDADGDLVDAKVRMALQQSLGGFVAHASGRGNR
jgi:hypothetical protein